MCQAKPAQANQHLHDRDEVFALVEPRKDEKDAARKRQKGPPCDIQKQQQSAGKADQRHGGGLTAVGDGAPEAEPHYHETSADDQVVAVENSRH